MTVAATLHLRRASGWLIAASLVAIGLATLTPQPSGATLPHYCLICGSFGTVDAILNVLLFVPLGVGLAGFRVRARNALLFVAALSVAIELTQLAIAGRDSTIGDVVFNTLGGALGFAIAARFRTLIAPGQRTAARLTFAAASLWIGLQCISCLAFKVLVTRAQYFVQVAPTLGGFSVFDGQVKAITVGSTEFSAGRVDDTPALRARIVRGEPLTALVVVREAPPRIAPIVRIADAHKEEIALLGLQGENLIFTERTWATALRLRRPLYELSHALGVASDSNQTRVRAQLTGNAVSLESDRDGQKTAAVIEATPSLAWMLFLPFQWRVTGSTAEALLSALWTACCLFPVGFWGGGAGLVRRESLRQKVLVALAAILLLTLGLTVVPLLLGVSASTPFDWVAAVLAVGIGGGLSRSRNLRRENLAKR